MKGGGILECQWNSLANLLSDLNGKYAEEIDVNNLSDSIPITSKTEDDLR